MLHLVLRRARQQLVGASLLLIFIATTASRPSSPQYGRPLPGPPRYDHSAALDPTTDKIYVFGGLAIGPDDNLEALNELWAYDVALDTWVDLSAGGGPTRRSGCGVAWDPIRHALLISGGTTLEEGCAADLWSYSASAALWRRLADLQQAEFTARRYHTFTYDPSRDVFWLMCGYCLDEPDRDFMPYNPVDDSWGILRLTPGAEGYRIRHCSVWDPIRTRLLVFGGEHPMYGGNPSQALYWQRVWAVDPVYDRWTILPDGGNLPQRRSWFVSGYDPYLDALVVYGGVAIEALPSHNYGVTGELWAYLISAGKWVRLDEGELPPRVAAAGVYCASRGQIIAFGGLSTDPFVPGAKEIHNETIVIPVEVPAQFHWTGGALLRGARGSRTALVQLPKASSEISNVRLLDAASGQVLSVADTARELSARVWRVTFPPVSPEELQAGAAGRLVASGFLVQESRAFLAPVGEPSRDETWVNDVSGGASSTSQTESGLRVSCRRGPSGWNILVSGTSTEPSLVVVDVRGRVVGHLEGGSPVAGTAYSYTWPGQWSGGGRPQAGVYFVQVRSGSRRASARIVLD